MATQNIVDRLVERLKTDPLNGGLLTEDDLRDIVAQAIPKAFFAPRVTKEGYYDKVQEPLINEVLQKVLREGVEKAVKVWFDANQEVFVKHWAQVMDKGILEYVQAVQSGLATAQVRSILSTWVTNLNEERMRQNLPQLPTYLL